jgi:hypothetical protein
MFAVLGSSVVACSGTLVLLRRLENDPRIAEFGRSIPLKRLVKVGWTGSVEVARDCDMVECRSVGI